MDRLKEETTRILMFTVLAVFLIVCALVLPSCNTCKKDAVFYQNEINKMKPPVVLVSKINYMGSGSDIILRDGNGKLLFIPCNYCTADFTSAFYEVKKGDVIR